MKHKNVNKNESDVSERRGERERKGKRKEPIASITSLSPEGETTSRYSSRLNNFISK